MVLEEVTGKVLPRGFASPLSDWGNPLGRWSREPAGNDDKDREEYILRLRWWQRDHKYLQSDCGLGLVFNRLLHWRLLGTQWVQNRDQNLKSDNNDNEDVNGNEGWYHALEIFGLHFNRMCNIMLLSSKFCQTQFWWNIILWQHWHSVFDNRFISDTTFSQEIPKITLKMLRNKKGI